MGTDVVLGRYCDHQPVSSHAFFGDQVVIWLRGDYTVGDATLSRFFALHYLFPFLIIGAVIVHLVALHSVKSSNPSALIWPQRQHPFHPYFTIKDYTLGIFLMYSVYSYSSCRTA